MEFGGISLWQLMIICFFILLYWLVRKTFKKSQKKETPQISGENFGMWKVIRHQEVQRHPLYGIKGWAKALWISLVFVWPIFGVLGLLNYDLFWGVFESASLFRFALITGVAGIGCNLYLGYKLWNKSEQFQILYTWINFVFVLLAIFLNPILYYYFSPPWVQEIISPYAHFSRDLIVSLASYGIFILYVWRSKRINVTCRERVRQDDPFLIQLNQSKSRQTVKPHASSGRPKPTENKSTVVEKQKEVSPPKKPAEPEKNLIDMTDEDFYAMAWREVEEGNQDEGLWARMFVENDGDENKTRVSYIKNRVEEQQLWLQELLDKKIEEEEKREETEKEKEEQEKLAEEQRIAKNIEAAEKNREVYVVRIFWTRSGLN